MNRLKRFVKYCLGWIYLFIFRYFKSFIISKSDIIFIFPYYHLGGAEQVHLDIVKAVSHKEVTVIFTHLSATDHYLPHFRESATIIELNSIINKKSNRVRKALFNTIAKAINGSKTVTHVFGCNSTYFYDILSLINTSKQRIDLIHAIAPNDSRISTLASSAKYIDTRVVINRKAKEDVLNIYRENNIIASPDKIRIISNGVDLSNIQDLSIKPVSEVLNVGFIGRWSDEKRPWIFLEIAKKIKLKFTGTHFKMAGSGMKGEKSRIQEAGVNYVGEITTISDLSKFYKELDLIIICSSTEGFPMVLMEAMPHGVIPVCTDVGGISEHIRHQENGILVGESIELEIIDSFVENLSDLITNDIKRLALAENARNYALNHFDIEKFNQSYRNLLS
ncbi:glycosyltransferase [Dokdonia sinensis]|uniref:Glycosyltransferase n=1 Tax=Dokdonia sinensis TaxID=2479847 RepID=A0A3M0G5A9_9FLAO|nr:glycosyltransferase family 4 protein [Dokdonia sinensis]RMB57422.1 glycosyltransferase [Dokdonia sinensis]